MKIDYELVEKIGATHYRNVGDYYKISNQELLRYNSNREWKPSILSPARVVEHVKPIPPKPQVRVEYEKVTESIFDLKDEFERGELYFKSAGDYYQITNEGALCNYALKMIYRRIEKPVDWRNLTIEFADKCGFYGIGAITLHHSDRFLEMCRIALRANGEL